MRAVDRADQYVRQEELEATGDLALSGHETLVNFDLFARQ